MNSKIISLDFHGKSLITLEHNNQPYVAMKPIVEAIGLDWKSQHSRIQRHPVLSTCMVMMTTQAQGDDQRREITCLPLNMLNGWLFGVDTRVCPHSEQISITT